MVCRRRHGVHRWNLNRDIAATAGHARDMSWMASPARPDGSDAAIRNARGGMERERTLERTLVLTVRSSARCWGVRVIPRRGPGVTGCFSDLSAVAVGSESHLQTAVGRCDRPAASCAGQAVSAAAWRVKRSVSGSGLSSHFQFTRSGSARSPPRCGIRRASLRAGTPITLIHAKAVLHRRPHRRDHPIIRLARLSLVSAGHAKRPPCRRWRAWRGTRASPQRA